MHAVYGGQLSNEISLTIDGKRVTCPRDSYILEAARYANIEIPTLCYLKGLTPTGACGICAVEVMENGERVLRHACRYKVKDDMVIWTNTPAVEKERIERITEILKAHPNDCLTCPKTAENCDLQRITHLFGINPEERMVVNRGFDGTTPAMTRDMNKCIACGRCVTVCDEVQHIGIYEMYVDPETGDRYARVKEGRSLNEAACINCGQCVKVCPVATLQERDALHEVRKAMRDPEITVVWQMAPAIQHSLGEEFGLEPGTDVTRKIAGAMKRLGDYAFSTDFSADVTIMEEGTELISRLQNGGVLPMMTSCCPGWIKYMEYNSPDLLPHLSSCKSPQQMFGALVKNYLPARIGVDPEKIFHVSIMPCIAKKYEYLRPEMESEGGLRDVDAVLTTREAAKLFKMYGIDLKTVEETDFDSFMGMSTGAGRIFGTSGGVMEAALRTVTHILTNGEMDAIEYKNLRGYRGVKEATIEIGDLEVNVAVVNGIGNVRHILEDIREGKSPYHFIEVMACPGGCLNGGGAPLLDVEKLVQRMNKMYESDADMPMRRSHENAEVQELYKNYLGEPCSHISHHILHTEYVDRSGEVKR